MIIGRYTNHRDEIESQVRLLDDGRIAVSLFDLGAFETVGTRTYPQGADNAAHTYARLIARATRSGDGADTWCAVGPDVYWEGEPLDCVHCSKEIESAYGVPE